MSELWAVDADPNSHGGGALIAASGASSPQTVFINNKAVIVHQTDANADALCPPAGPPHCNPQTSSHSATVFAYNHEAHRNNDSRVCGAATVVSGQSTVFCG